MSEYSQNISSGRRNGKIPKPFSSGKTGSIFENVYLDTSKEIEKQKVLDSLNDANVIGFRNERGNIHPGQNLENMFDRPKATRDSTQRDSFIDDQPMSLTGEPFNKENFTHNNMTPFFGGQVRQNVDVGASRTLLETFTGVPVNAIQKEEVPNMFELQRENIYGAPDMNDDFEKRYNPSKYRQGVPLTTPVQVGPGLNAGYTNNPTGGFQQMDTRKYVMPRTTDEIRVKTNPKQSYGGRIMPGFIGSRRGIQSNVETNRPIRFHTFDEPRFNTTVVTTGRTLHPDINVKCTNRNDTSTAYTGTAGPSVVKKPEKYSNYAPEVVHKQSLPSSGPRNATSAIGPKQATIKYCSKVRETQKETESDYLGLAASVVKRMIAPVQDIMKTTVRETTEDHGRPEGYVGTSVKKSTIYDTDDIARTTIKETLIHSGREGNVGKLGYKGSTYQEDAPKTTARETLKNFITEGNLAGNKKIIRPNVIANTTTRETTLHTPPQGHVAMGQIGQGYITNPKEAPSTARQFISDNDYTGQATGGEKGAYKVTNVNAPPTARQFTANNEYTGIAEGELKPMSYADIYNATINEVKETIATSGREPTKTSVKLSSGQHEIGNVQIKEPLEEPNSLNKTRLVNIHLDPLEESVTTQKNSLCDKDLSDRIDPEQLKVFMENPYTQSLNSSA